MKNQIALPRGNTEWMAREVTEPNQNYQRLVVPAFKAMKNIS